MGSGLYEGSVPYIVPTAWEDLLDFEKASWEAEAIRRAEMLATLKEQSNGPV